MPGLEAAFGSGLTSDLPNCDGLRKAFETLRAEIVELKDAADKPARRLTDRHGARLGQSLQPRREIRGLADHEVLVGQLPADQVADYHNPGGDTGSGGEPLPVRGGHASNSLRHRQAGPTARSASSSWALGHPK